LQDIYTHNGGVHVRWFVSSDFLKMKCVCKTQMMPPSDHQNPVDMHTSIMCINIMQNIKAVAKWGNLYQLWGIEGQIIMSKSTNH
jgi:hypothetical protein